MVNAPELKIQDLRTFTQKQEKIDGLLVPYQMPRIKADMFDVKDNAGGNIAWQASGFMQRDTLSEATPYLNLTIEGSVRVQCQRCLEAVDYPINVSRTFAFVATEQEAETAELENDEIDFLVLDKNFDLFELIEDEILLALPAHPKHEACNQTQEALTQQKKSPFAILATLKQTGKPH